MTKGGGWKRGEKKDKKKEPEHLVVNYKPFIDEFGREYLAFCNYRWHQGFIRKTDEYCIVKKCAYLKIIYLDTLPSTHESANFRCDAEDKLRKQVPENSSLEKLTLPIFSKTFQTCLPLPDQTPAYIDEPSPIQPSFSSPEYRADEPPQTGKPNI